MKRPAYTMKFLKRQI